MQGLVGIPPKKNKKTNETKKTKKKKARFGVKEPCRKKTSLYGKVPQVYLCRSIRLLLTVDPVTAAMRRSTGSVYSTWNTTPTL